ncbi:MAG: YciI family protein [Phycisphaerales bacterium]|nr:YciI family protein [Phycisphaerales bacterium]MCI0676509.1 YciI family protein [Phycisphaerales bacterium]
MRYVLFVCTDPSAEPYDPAQDNVEEWVSQYDSKGIRIMGDRLANVDKAVTVRVRKGQRLISDGPFAETKEWIAGFDLIECESLDQAIEVASRHPMARFGRIEVRPLWTTD